MNTADQLMAGYAVYTTSDEIGAGAAADAPAISPVSIFSAASSVECAIFSAGVVTSASAGGTVAGNC
ncbi:MULTISPECIES: LxmA leader domain family RiPP [Streptomyces]|uniref:LxmA leader domain family RiPP n=1 Tax=Streptomyces sp. R28 TaxID=3238628 RepID=A0AB39Q209_9ACTN|nr:MULTISPECIES: LxmA leader domain family RiPP [Streptomyces]MDF3148902.1 LxmA leader domain family RiPP [Streptomyces sp. T21Q-yed]WDF39843.1 LxmA leader domain family RiPP [Streptomyces sp. T12]